VFDGMDGEAGHNVLASLCMLSLPRSSAVVTHMLPKKYVANRLDRHSCQALYSLQSDIAQPLSTECLLQACNT
jgi:hypothetical protein